MSNSDQQVTDTVRTYLTNGRLPNAASTVITVNRSEPLNAVNTASRITVSYPFSFIVLNPVAKLVVKTSTTGQSSFMMQSVALMRNEI
jgi:hypothetical protein